MRVCFIALAPFPGIYLPELRHMSNELIRLGIIHTVIAQQTGHEPPEEHNGPQTIKRLATPNRIATESFFSRAAALAEADKFDVVHVIWRFGAGFIPRRSAWLKRHALLDIRTGSIDPRAWRRIVENSLLRADRRPYQWATTVDQCLGQTLNLKVNAYLPHGVSEEMVGLKAQIRESRDELRRRYHIPSTAKLGLFVGTSVSRNLPILFQAVQQARLMSPELRVVVIGDASQSPVLVKAAQSADIQLVPSVVGLVLAEWLAIADFGISFIPITPGFTNQQSTKLLDYFLFHLPVLATDTKSNRQFITEVNGIRHDDTVAGTKLALSQLIEKLGRPDYLTQMADHDDALLMTYNWPRIVEQTLLPLYQKIAT